MELWFGCEVRAHPDTKDLGIYLVVGEKHANHYPTILKGPDHKTIYSFGENAGFEILGRPIRLADVLHMIQMYGVPAGLGYWNVIADITGKSPFLSWNFLKDDLREQSEETLSFLAELLK